MAHLVNCFECGAEVSSEAKYCPKCRLSIHGYYCFFCKKRLERGNQQSPFHKECKDAVIEEYESFRINCSLCKHSWHPFSFKSHECSGLSDYTKQRGSFRVIDISKACPECGHPFNILEIFKKVKTTYSGHDDEFELYRCVNCNLPLIPALEIKIHLSSDWYVHQHCYKYNYNYHHKAPEQNENNQIENSEQPKNSSICFLATALYGEDSSKVQMLCFFRDEYLSASSLGRAFIALYARFSPPLARAIAKESLLRTLVRYCIVAPALLITEKFLAYAGRKEKLKQ